MTAVAWAILFYCCVFDDKTKNDSVTHRFMTLCFGAICCIDAQGFVQMITFILVWLIFCVLWLGTFAILSIREIFNGVPKSTKTPANQA